MQVFDRVLASGDIQEVSGLSAEIASNLLDHMGSDATPDELASTFYTVQALQAFAAVQGDGSDQVADAGGAAGGETAASTSSAAPETTATTADDHTQPTPAASQDHQGDMMFA
jgi:hypothetical protein